MEEENIRELRSSRSRSNTPLIRARESTHGTAEVRRATSATQIKGRLRGGNGQKSGLTSVTESHMNVTTVRHVHRKTGNDSDSSNEHAVENEQKIDRRSDRQRAKRRLLVNGATLRKEDEVLAMAAEAVKEEDLQKTGYHKMSDFSSEGGEGIAYQIYKKAGDWWNKFPKTDYTYSPVSPHRKELAPGVIAMPNMSRRSLKTMHHYSSTENKISPSSTVTSVSKHRVTKSRWFDPSLSGSQASRKVLEDWAAIDSDVDEVAESLSSKTSSHISKSWTVTSVITSFFMVIWTFITVSYTGTVDAVYRLVGHPRDTDIYTTPRRVVLPVRGEGSSSWLPRTFSWAYQLFLSIMHLDTLLLSSWRTTRVEQEHELFYEQDDSTETDAVSKSFSSHKRNTWRLFLLLLPLIFLAGWWGMSEPTIVAFNPLVGAADTAWNALVGLILIPFEAYRALKEKLFVSLTLPELPHGSQNPQLQQQQSVDMETLAHYIMASPQFQQLLITETQDKGQIESDVHQRKDFYHMSSELLEEQKASLSQLSLHLQQIQQKVDHLSSEVDGGQAHVQEWEHKLVKETQALRQEVAAQSLIRDSNQVLLRKELRDVQNRLRLLQEQQAQVSHRCCQRNTGPVKVDGDVIEQHVFRVLAGLLGATGGQFSGNPEDLRAWVSSMFLAWDGLEARLANLTFTLHLQTREAVQRSKEIIMASVSEHVQNEFAKWQEQQQHHDVTSTISSMGTWVTNSSGVAGLTDLQVRAIVDEALAKYDADKTGLVDYALESSGGSVISTRCTETYQAKTAKLSLLGIPLWYPSNNPRTVIQPGVHPGECWAFSGSQGFLVIKLSGLVQITAFSLEHIPRTLSPHGRIDSAPKDFTIWGLKDVQDMEPVLLGKYMYQQNGTSLQNFSVQRSDVDPFEFVELRIESNHGNMEYTCLYRFRVHGVLFSK
ncbi:uncharacterized protein LOC110827610 isoform X2 [Zootermopsis nevadensis]|uniref:Unc-84-like protein A n=1 Tax=Zootermopsis nevadensis TaxID=136037 RepID=A0A067RWJ8_ZOONE|nr:uncharacterized protein LOC110827610 isoform X2 [Zootermopsis nevadensis]KDR24279.1 Unc-84-like protein A [Zootermopsis nevadensis]